MGRPTTRTARQINPRELTTTWRIVPIGHSTPLAIDHFDTIDDARVQVSRLPGSFAIVDVDGRHIEIRDRAGCYRTRQFPTPR